MNCPADDSQLHQVKIVSHYGEPIILDQCEKCGGIWFDQSELFKAKQGEAEKIEPLNPTSVPNATEIERATLICPRDKAALVQFTDKNFPQTIILMRCPSCGGIWLKRGLFTRYQQFRQELQHPEVQIIDKNADESIRKLLSTYQSGRDTTQMLEKLGRFLSTPIDEQSPSPQGPPEISPAAETTITIALNILMAILSALIRK